MPIGTIRKQYKHGHEVNKMNRALIRQYLSLARTYSSPVDEHCCFGMHVKYRRKKMDPNNRPHRNH